jgi:hypothetical protein
MESTCRLFGVLLSAVYLSLLVIPVKRWETEGNRL